MDHSNQTPSPANGQRWGVRSLFGLLLVGPLLGGATGAHWGWRYLQQDLVPQIGADLSQSLNRPVQLGAVQQFSLGGLRLGASAIPAIATDADTLTLEAVDIRVQPLASLRQRKVQLIVTLIKPTITIRQEADGHWVATELNLDDDTDLEIHQIRIQNGTLRILPHPDFTADATPLQFHRLHGGATLGKEGDQMQVELAGRSPDSGQFRVTGEMDFPEEAGQLRVWGRQVAIAPLARLLPPEVWIQGGQANADLRVRLRPDQIPSLEGRAEVWDFAARAEGEPNPFTQTRGRFRFEGQTIAIDDGFVKFGRIPFQVGGSIHLQRGLNLEATVASLEVQDFMDTFKLKLPFPATGALKTDNLRVTGPFDQVTFSGTVTNAVPITLDRLQVNARTDFVLDKTDDHLSLINLQVFPKVGGQITANADIAIKDEGSDVALTAEAEHVSADAIATLYRLPTATVTLGTLNATATVAVANDTPQVALDWHLTEGTYPAQGRLIVDDDRLALQDGRIQVGTGTAQVAGQYGGDRWHLELASQAIPLHAIRPDLPGVLTGNLALTGRDFTRNTLEGSGEGQWQLADGTIGARLQVGDRQWQGQLTARDLPLAQLAADLPGTVHGTAVLAGDLAQVDPRGIRTTGQVQLVDLLPQWRSPIQADFRWNGHTFSIPTLSSAGLRATAALVPSFDGWQLAEFKPLNGRVTLQADDLQTLPLDLPAAVQLTGQAHLAAAIAGTVRQPQVAGTLQLAGLAVNQLAFAPTLQGPVQWNAAEGLQMVVVGGTDRMALRTTGDRRQFSLQWQEATVQGDWQGDRLTAQLRHLNLAPLRPWLPLPASLSAIQGELSADVTAHLATQSLVGSIGLDRPQLGPLGDEWVERHRGDRLTAQVQYQEGQLTIPQGQFTFGESRYRFTGSFQPDTEALAATVSSDRSEAQDMLTLAQWIAPQSATLAAPVQSFLDTLPLPALAVTLPSPESPTLNGFLAGTATLSRHPQTGLALNFDLHGQDWQLGVIGVNQIILQGHHTDPAPLTFEALVLEGLHYGTVESAEAISRRLQFAGSLNPHHLAGELQLLDLPLPLLGQLFNLPVLLQGNVSAIASLNGSIANPQVDGSLQLSNIQAPLLDIDRADVGFTYHDAQFRLNSWSE